MIMKNIIDNYDLVTHIFDIKGSEYRRKVIKDYTLENFEEIDSGKVLKDKDFKNYIRKL